jgi:acetolactate synthase-1/2/3 large subunit
VEPECRQYPAFRTQPSSKVLKKVVKNLLECRRPVLVTGGGANHSQAGEVILKLAEWLESPVVTTISGQGVMDDGHRLALGVVGDNGFHPHAVDAVEKADLLFYLGCKMGSVSTMKWTLPSLRPDLKIIQLDMDPTILGNNYQNSISLNGDVRQTLEVLFEMLTSQANPREPRPFVEELNQKRKEFWQKAGAEFSDDSLPLKPQRIIHALNQRLPSPSVVIADAGTPTPYTTRYLRLGGGGSRFLIPRAYGGLGYAIPAVAGAHFACPKAKVVGLFGDGSLGMSAGELETLKRLNIPAVLIHFNNSCFGWIKALQAIHCQGNFQSVDFTSGDMSLVARGFGMEACHVKTAAELDQALDQAFAAKEPFFVDVLTETETKQTPPVFSWLKATGKDTACG